MWIAFSAVVPWVLTLLSTESTRQPPAAYCGIECVYAASRLLGREVAFTEFLQPSYVGSRAGSSLQELRQAAQDCGLSAVPIRNCNTQVLRACPHPVILHVRSSPTAKTYNHFILFLGTQNGKAALFDPPHPVRHVSWPELAGLWDGKGLMISVTPVDPAPILAPARRRALLGTAAIVAIVLAARGTRRRLTRPQVASCRRTVALSLAQSVVLGLAALLGGLLYHSARNEGLLANAQATQGIQQAHASSFIPRLAASHVRRLLGTRAVFVDARLQRDYQAGHLAGALNVPVDANETTRRSTMSAVSKEARIVVYCQSRRCRFAEKVAVDLVRDGFSDVAVYRDGWSDWIRTHPLQKSTGSRDNTGANSAR